MASIVGASVQARDQLGRLLHAQRSLEDIRRTGNQIVRQIEAILCRIKPVEHLLSKLQKADPALYPDFLAAILKQLGSPMNTLRNSHSRQAYNWDPESDYNNDLLEELLLGEKNCLTHALDILGRTLTEVHECDISLTEPLIETQLILDELFEKINQGVFIAPEPVAVRVQNVAKVEQVFIPEEPQVELQLNTPQGWNRIADVKEFHEKNLMEKTSLKAIQILLPDSTSSNSLFTEHVLESCTTKMPNDFSLNDTNEIDALENPAESQQFFSSKNLHMEETLIPTDSFPMQYKASAFIDKESGRFNILVEEITYEPSKELMIKAEDQIPQVVLSYRLVSFEITPTKQLIATVEGRRNGNHQFVVLGQLPLDGYDGLMDEPTPLSIIALDPLKNDLTFIDRARTDSNRKLFGVVKDNDELGITTLGEDWQLNELDEFESANKLLMEISAGSARIVDYAFETGESLNSGLPEDNSIVAAAIYKSGDLYHLTQAINQNGIAAGQKVAINEPSSNTKEPKEKYLSLAVALSPASSADAGHKIWVLGISAPSASKSSKPQQNPVILPNSSSPCKLTLHGWQSVKLPDGDGWELQPVQVGQAGFEMNVGCSLDSIAEMGMNARMIAVPRRGDGSKQGLGLRLVAILGALSKCFIIEVKPRSSNDKTWEFKGIEWDLAGYSSVGHSYPANYQLKLVSNFAPSPPNENHSQSKEPEEGAMVTDDGGSFRDNRPRVSLYSQELAREFLLVFD